jgi:hypothetical protein
MINLSQLFSKNAFDQLINILQIGRSAYVKQSRKTFLEELVTKKSFKIKSSRFGYPIEFKITQLKNNKFSISSIDKYNNEILYEQTSKKFNDLLEEKFKKQLTEDICIQNKLRKQSILQTDSKIKKSDKLHFGQIRNDLGKRAEIRVTELIEDLRTELPWIVFVSTASKKEDYKGIDLIVETDCGKIFLQIKSSKIGVEKFTENKKGKSIHHENHILCLLINQLDSNYNVRFYIRNELIKHRRLILESRNK